jgi:hypothetical protein
VGENITRVNFRAIIKKNKRVLSRVSDVAAIVHPRMCDGGIYLVNVGRQGILCLLAVKNGVGVAT